MSIWHTPKNSAFLPIYRKLKELKKKDKEERYKEYWNNKLHKL